MVELAPEVMVSDKVRENRLRRMAERQGLHLTKSSKRDPFALGYGKWSVISADGRRVSPEHGWDLEEVAAYLTTPPAQRSTTP